MGRLSRELLGGGEPAPAPAPKPVAKTAPKAPSCKTRTQRIKG